MKRDIYSSNEELASITQACLSAQRPDMSRRYITHDVRETSRHHYVCVRREVETKTENLEVIKNIYTTTLNHYIEVLSSIVYWQVVYRCPLRTSSVLDS